jgi:hypothetical protein
LSKVFKMIRLVVPGPWQRSLRDSKPPLYLSPALLRYCKNKTPHELVYMNWKFLKSAAGSRWLLEREKRLRADVIRKRTAEANYYLLVERRTARKAVGFY